MDFWKLIWFRFPSLFSSSTVTMQVRLKVEQLSCNSKVTGRKSEANTLKMVAVYLRDAAQPGFSTPRLLDY